ncbi:hypothetical protein GCK72_014165 [Caenorhabditis remanei]|uniref:Non-structural maintenance of chromosomes element 4 n=1 Tax=Caenorhabditis remanei TaxID=31234 RepID=A0A6A5GTA7_CAERE|nr:hypothetical protein GCK72_014165 [Caenorhabditis remanei]KAF1757709.1 hypothetical protein GCK72_014165 [Caenorhabditis remanei]
MSNSEDRRKSSKKLINEVLRQVVSNEKIEQIRNRPQKNATEKFKENHAVAEELKKQIAELSHIRKTETVATRIQKIDLAVATLQEQSKPLRKALNSGLYSTDTELMELVAQTTRETLLEIGSSAAIDPVEVGMKISVALKQVSAAAKHYVPDKTEWCDEWIVDEDMEQVDELYNDMYRDTNISESHRFAAPLGYFHRYGRELHLFSKSVLPDSKQHREAIIRPAVYPFNVDVDFILQLVDVDRAEKQKKVREKAEKGSRKKEKAELVKVNDKVNQADNVQSEEVSISRELKHVLSVFKKELKKRQTDKLSYYEFVTNPKSFSRTVENMFYVSYQMRDREMFLVEEDGVPILKRPGPWANDQERKQAEKENSTHGVMSLSYEEWKLLSRGFKSSIIEPLD